MASSDQEPTLADVLAHLDGLAGAVRDLTEAVRGVALAPARAAAASPAAPQPAPVPAVGGPSAAAPSPLAPPEPRVLLDPTNPALAGVGRALTRLFHCAMIEDKEECFEALEGLWHEAAIASPRSLDYLRAFNWPKLRRSLPRYLDDVSDPHSYGITRVLPADFEGVKAIRVFLDQKGAMPAPVQMVRDEEDSDEWRFDQISL
jgi:hypothetical protein